MKKSIFITMIGALLMVITFSSCSSKQYAINRLENLSEEIDRNGQYYTVGDWEDTAEKFVKIRKNINKHRYTSAERRRIGQLEGNCAKAVVNGLKGQVQNWGSELKGILESLKEILLSRDRNENYDM